MGLLLCGYALWHSRVLVGDAIHRVSAVGCAIVGVLLCTCLLFAVMAWRRYLLAYTGRDPGWRVAARQLGLLLVGKYVPGGVFGFMARLYDQRGGARQPLVWAGLIEQIVGIAMSVALGGVLYLAAAKGNVVWLALLPALPLLALAGVWVLHRFAARLPRLRCYADDSQAPAWSGLLVSITMQLAQLLAWAVLVAVLASELFGLGGYASFGLAGAFLLAVAAGMLVVFVPGGIGVREAALVGLASYWLVAEQAIFLAALLRLLSSLIDGIAGAVAAMIGSSEGGDG